MRPDRHLANVLRFPSPPGLRQGSDAMVPPPRPGRPQGFRHAGPVGAILPVREISTDLRQCSPCFLVRDREDLLIDKLAALDCDRLFLFVDEGVMHGQAERFAEQCRDRLGARASVRRIAAGVAPGRAGLLAQVCEQAAGGASRYSAMLGFGGSAVCRLVGRAAALVCGGIRYIEVPTGTAGQIDGSLRYPRAAGGRKGREPVGWSMAPEFIWSDTRYLDAEPLHRKRAGLVCAIRNGLVADPVFLEALSALLRPDLEYSASEQHSLVHKAILSTLRILRADPDETHYARVLECGQVFAQAIEWMSCRHGVPIVHGEALGIGLQLAARLSRRLGLLVDADLEWHRYLIEDRLGLRTPLPSCVTPEALVRALQEGSRLRGSAPRFVLLERIGRCHNPEGDYLVGVEPQRVAAAIADLLDDHRKRPRHRSAGTRLALVRQSTGQAVSPARPGSS